MPDPDQDPTRIQKFWNRSGVGDWKSDSGHLCRDERTVKFFSPSPVLLLQALFGLQQIFAVQQARPGIVGTVQ